MEDQVLMTHATKKSPKKLLTVRVEVQNPTLDWPSIWKIARTKGLGSDLTALMFRLLHQLLPTQDRVARLGGDQAVLLSRLSHCLAEVEDQLHALFFRPKSLCPWSSFARLCTERSPI